MCAYVYVYTYIKKKNYSLQGLWLQKHFFSRCLEHPRVSLWGNNIAGFSNNTSLKIVTTIIMAAVPSNVLRNLNPPSQF